MTRRRGPRPVAVGLERLLTTLAPATVLAEIQRVWPEAVGTVFAPVTRPVGEKEGIVRVDCESAVYAQELTLMSDRVVLALNERLVRARVEGLRCRVRSAQR